MSTKSTPPAHTPVAVEAEARPSASRRALIKGAVGAAVAPFAFGEQAWAAVAGPAAGPTWAASTDALLYAAVTKAAFTQELPNPMVAAYKYLPDPGTTNVYTITTSQGTKNILGVTGRNTTVWGYRNWQSTTPIYPGMSFVVQRDAPIIVRWKNDLTSATGAPLPHLLPVDQTISMQSPTTGVPIAVHHHGGDTAETSDGGPDQWLTPIRSQVGPGITAANMDPTVPGLRYEYTNAQEASMHWYHDHAEGLTRTNVVAGLAGLYIVRDAYESLVQTMGLIPAATHEIALVIQDRVFTKTGQYAYSADPVNYPGALTNFPSGNPTHMPEVFGDVILVNGSAWPKVTVEPRPYRLRFLNGSDSRFYKLFFSNNAAKMLHMGSDLGLTNSLRSITTLLIGPGERQEVVVDFSTLTGQTLFLVNNANTPYPGGSPSTGMTNYIARFDVKTPLNTAIPKAIGKNGDALRGLNATSALVPGLRTAPAGTVERHIMLGEGVDEYGRITPLLGTYDPVNPAKNLGTLHFQDPPTETPALNSTEIWVIHNTTVDAHPMHFHLVQFSLYDRVGMTYNVVDTVMSSGWTGRQITSAVVDPTVPTLTTRAPEDEGWKDTIVCPPGTATKILVNFKRPGKYVYHCHILSHEEHDMMRWYSVI